MQCSLDFKDNLEGFKVECSVPMTALWSGKIIHFSHLVSGEAWQSNEELLKTHKHILSFSVLFL